MKVVDLFNKIIGVVVGIYDILKNLLFFLVWFKIICFRYKI